MSTNIKFCDCGSLLGDDGVCTNKRCLKSLVKRKGWCINGVFLDFDHKVTYREAEAAYHRVVERGVI